MQHVFAIVTLDGAIHYQNLSSVAQACTPQGIHAGEDQHEIAIHQHEPHDADEQHVTLQALNILSGCVV